MPPSPVVVSLLRPLDTASMAVPGASEDPMDSTAKPPAHSGDTSCTVTATGCLESGTLKPKIFRWPWGITVVTPAASSSTAAESAHASSAPSQEGLPEQMLRQSTRK